MANELATKISSFALLLKNKQAEIASVLPKHVTPERIIKVALQAASRNQLLLQCKAESFYLSVLCASELGLEPGGPLARAHMVPFKNNKTGGYECTLIPDYRGLIDLARRSGKIEDIDARVVREGDVFEYEFGLERKCKHIPKADIGAKMTHVYAIAYLTGGAKHFTVLTRAEVERFRSKSRAKDSGPWVTDYDAMAVKTAIRRLCNLLPQSVEMSKALAMDNANETPDERYVPEVMVDVTPAAPKPETKIAAIKKEIAGIKEDVEAIAAEAEEEKQEKVNYILTNVKNLDKTSGKELFESILAGVEATPEGLFAAEEKILDAATAFIGERIG